MKRSRHLLHVAAALIFSVQSMQAQTVSKSAAQWVGDLSAGVNANANAAAVAQATANAANSVLIPGAPAPLTQATLWADTVNVKNFGASGSGYGLVVNSTAGSTTLPLGTAADFRTGQGIRLDHAGAAFSAGASSISAISSLNGATGAKLPACSSNCVTFTYEVASLDYAGGVGVASAPVSIQVSAGLLSWTNQVQLTVSLGSNASGYAIYRSVSGVTSGNGGWTGANGTQAAGDAANSAMTYLNVASGGTYADTGWINPVRAEYLPAAPLTAALPDWLVTQITAGGGTSTLTLAAAPTVSGPVNAFHDDTAAIQLAINTRNTAIGGKIDFPCGTYNTTGRVTVAASTVGLVGRGQCSVLQPYGADQDIVIQGGSPSSFIRGNEIGNFYVPSYNKTGGHNLYAQYFQTLDVHDLIVDHPYDVALFNDFNDLRIRHHRAYAFYGSGATYMRFTSDATNYACCIFMMDAYGTGNGNAGNGSMSGHQHDKGGFVFDGNVATVQAHSLAVSNVEGTGLGIGNAVGNPSRPQFFELFDFDAEFSQDRNVEISAGWRIYFHIPNIHGAQSGINVAIEAASGNNGPYTIGFNGGFVTGAKCQGFFINGTDVKVTGMDVGSNSNPYSGGTAGACPQIEIGGSARGVVINGNNIGDVLNPTWGSYPVQIDNGADTFAIVGNTYLGNVNNSTLNNAGTGSSKVVGPNAGSAN